MASKVPHQLLPPQPTPLTSPHPSFSPPLHRAKIPYNPHLSHVICIILITPHPQNVFAYPLLFLHVPGAEGYNIPLKQLELLEYQSPVWDSRVFVVGERRHYLSKGARPYSIAMASDERRIGRRGYDTHQWRWQWQWLWRFLQQHLRHERRRNLRIHRILRQFLHQHRHQHRNGSLADLALGFGVTELIY